MPGFIHIRLAGSATTHDAISFRQTRIALITIVTLIPHEGVVELAVQPGALVLTLCKFRHVSDICLADHVPLALWTLMMRRLRVWGRVHILLDIV